MAKFIDSREFYDTTSTLGVYLPPIHAESRVDFCRTFDATGVRVEQTHIRTALEFYHDFTAPGQPDRRAKWYEWVMIRRALRDRAGVHLDIARDAQS